MGTYAHSTDLTPPNPFPKLRMNAARPLLLGLALLAPAVAFAQSTGPGQVRSYLVKGTVELVDESTGTAVPLRPGRIFSHGFSIRSGRDGSASLYLSNGASVVLQPNSSLTVAQFQQAPFSPTLGSFHTLSADPSRSAVQLNLNQGSMSGRVRQLQPSSTFDVQTPLGRVAVHGTTFNIEVTTGPDGKPVARVTNLDGGVTFHPLEGTPSVIAAGTVISVRTDPTGATPTTVIFDTRAVDQNTANMIYKAILDALGEDPSMAISPIFVPVQVDPSVVSPEGGSGT